MEFQQYAELLGKALLIIIPIGVIAIIIFAINMMFNPKFSGKMMNRQVKATRYMMEESKEDFAKMASAGVEIKNKY